MSSNIFRGTDLTIKQLFTGRKFCLEFFQREYTWTERHVRELLDDLTSRFLDEYDENDQLEQIINYKGYFLGPIVTSQAGSSSSLIDGQQRLTSLTLLLIRLHHLSKDKGAPNLEPLVFDDYLGKKTFNINVPERNDVMQAILKAEDFDTANQLPSVRRIYANYNDIKDILPEEFENEKLIFFIYWLLERVILVEISTSDQDMALEVFENMNDRGMRLSATDMLKSFLLSKVGNKQQIDETNQFWRKRITKLSDLYKGAEIDFIRVWLRSKYAENMRARKKGASPADFDIIYSSFHRWVRDNRDTIGLSHTEDYKRLIDNDFAKLSYRWIQFRKACWNITPGLEEVYYNHNIGIGFQDLPVMATITPDDDEPTFRLKTKLVTSYLDMLVARRILNFNNYGFSTVGYMIFNLVKDIRNIDPDQLREELQKRVSDLPSFAGANYFGLHYTNRKRIRYMLARMTAWIEQECGKEDRFSEYFNRYRPDPYEVEHIWASKFDAHKEEFDNEHDFGRHRNRFGGLLLLPKSFNASFGAKSYEEKLEHYHARNLLASSLHRLTYENNPWFNSFIARTGLPFKPYPDGFRKADIEERTDLYRQICEQVWDPDRLLRIEPESGV